MTETETSQMQFLQSHYDKMSETSGLTKNQMALLTAEAKIGGGWNFIAKVGADGSVLWRGQTVEADAWNRMRDYAESNQVLDLWSSVSEASRRYSSSTGDSETVGLEENLGANLANMQALRGAGVPCAPAIGKLVGAGGEGPLGGPGHRPGARPAVLCMVVGQGGGGWKGHRRGGGDSPRFAPDPGGVGGSAGTCESVHRGTVSGDRGTEGGFGPGRGRIRNRERRHAEDTCPRHG